MAAPDYNVITEENLDQFLDFHINKPLPDWFVPFEGINENSDIFDYRDGFIHVRKNYNTEMWESHGLSPVPYIANNIVYVEIPGNAVSSKFSGCEMAAFKFPRESDKRYVCHIATGESVGKDLINHFNNDSAHIAIETIFHPSKITDIILNLIGSKRFSEYQVDPASGTFGIITQGNVCYSILTKKTDDARTVFAWIKWNPKDTTQFLVFHKSFQV